MILIHKALFHSLNELGCGVCTIGNSIDLHIADMKEVGKAPGRSKDATLKMLNRELGSRNMAELDRKRLIRFGGERATEARDL